MTRAWDDPDWEPTATAWISRVLTDLGVRITGPVERARTRFWSAHLSVPTDAGRFWFKENCPLQSFEARLVAALQPVAGQLVVEVSAVEPERGWLLTPDQGLPVRDTDRAADVETYEQLLVTWGTLQRRVVGAGIDLAGCGLTTLAPSAAAAFVEREVDRLAALPADDGGRLDPATADRLRTLAPRVRQWAETVAATGLPSTLQHSDLHLGNAFRVDDGRTERLRVFDFSDAVVSFPLGSLLVPLRVLRRGEHGITPDRVAAERVVDAYLETWSDLAPAAELRAALPAALELARLDRYESWRRVLDGADAASYAEFGNAPAAWLGMLGTDPFA